MRDNLKNYLRLHFIVFVWGWTAVLGKIITLPPLQLIWMRVALAFTGMLAFAVYIRAGIFPSRGTVLKLLGIGVIVGIHWICFYGAVKVSNVSVTLACFSTGTLFTAFIEPVFYKRKVLWYEILFGLVVIGALLMIFNVETQYKLGMLLGAGAALTSSFMGVLNGIMTRQNNNPAVISMYEMIGCWACVSAFLFIRHPETGSALFTISWHDWFYLLILSICCTTVPFIIGVHILRHVSPYTVSLTLNLETIYGIIFAFFIFHKTEKMSATFYAGALIILATIFANAALKNYLGRQSSQ